MNSIAIIGGGASGTLTATQLLRRAGDRPLHITLIEKNAELGRGLAYGTRCPQHLLNVVAARMSALPADPDHFLRWLQCRDKSAIPGTFAPRARYGEYLSELLEEAIRAAGPAVRFERIADEAQAVRDRNAVRAIAATNKPGRTAATEHQPAFKLALRSGRVLDADRVVLALGNFPPADPALPEGDFRRAQNYIRDPWSPAAFDGLSGDESLLLIGTGLTAIDCIAELHSRGHRGRVTAISRHGLLPQAHEYGTTTHAMNGELAEAHTVRQLVRVLRHAAGEATREERGWRGVMDALRPRVQQIWLALPPAERQRFLRHARAYWDVHRHRVAPEVDAVVQSLRASGQLVVRAARLQRYQEESSTVSPGAGQPKTGQSALVTLRPRGAATVETLRVARVINCTGPVTVLRQSDSPLLRTLTEGGLARFDALGLGLDVDAHGALLNAAGKPSAALFAVGPLRKGALWETTAIPEIRVQAEALAGELLA